MSNSNISIRSHETVRFNNCEGRTGPGARGNECTICEDVITPDDEAVIHLGCGNSWQSDCLVECYKICQEEDKHTTCPLCRECMVSNPEASKIGTAIHDEDDSWLGSFFAGNIIERRSRRRRFHRRARNAIAIWTTGPRLLVIGS